MLDEIDRLKAENAGLLAMKSDLACLVQRLARKHHDTALATKAMQYVVRKDLIGDYMRNTEFGVTDGELQRLVDTIKGHAAKGESHE